MDEERDESNSSVSCSEEVRVRNVVSDSESPGGGLQQPSSVNPKGHPHQKRQQQRNIRPFNGKGKFLRYRKSAGSVSTIKLRNNERRVIPSNGTNDFDEKIEQQNSDARFANQNNVRKRCPRRRERHNKWKPYHLLSFDERRNRDERETKRAEERRNQLTTLGFPQAPYNTTQFLMNDHKSEHDNTFQESAVLSSDDSNVAENDMDDGSLDRGYDQEWSRVLTANLSLLSKDGLIDYALRTEREKSDLERRLRKLELEMELVTGSYSDDAAEVSMMEEPRPPILARAESV